MNNFYPIKAGTVSKPTPTWSERLTAGGIGNWRGDEPGNKDAKKQAKLAIAYTLANGAMVTLAYMAVSPITGLIAVGIGIVNGAFAESSMNAYKLAKVDGLLAKEDVDELMAIIGENKKIQAKLSSYDKDMQVRDLPDNLKKECYKTIVRQYVAMRNLKKAVQEAKAG